MPIERGSIMVGIIRREPFGDVFDDFFRGFLVKPLAYEQPEGARGMRLDVTEQSGAYSVLAELPGAKKEDIQVQINGDQVSISAEVRGEREEKEGKRVVHSERYYGKLARSFQLGQDIDEAKVQARFTDGILELTLPKKAAATSRQITIQ
jgi:HSP20 family protein